ncbi:MAG: C4-dicarboxylate ABC transporter [Pseudomonas sp. BICA1-14]|nr:TRAP transporter substrate-binding protein DctP [[Pseudomonas] sp. BICA1-14]KJS78752.1 MAG: C4-dicarboxylate ABC transporter [[Pseudomonas] sp. BICA1-14]
MKNALHRTILSGAIAGLLGLGVSLSAVAADSMTLKVSHQFPGGTIDEGDFRDRLVRKFAQEVEQRSNGELKFEIFPASSLVKTPAQFGALQKGSIDMTLYPLAYEGGKIPQVNITLMPGLVTSYEQGHRWKQAPIGQELERILEDKGVKVITWIWQAGGVAAKPKAVLVPEDIKGTKIRGGSKHMDMMFKAGAASVTNVPSSEVYSAMQTGVLDSTVTSSTSILSFRLEEVADHVTTAEQNTFWFMFEPLLMAKSTFERLSPEQQKLVMEVGASLEQFSIDESKKDDFRVAEVFEKAGKKAYRMDDAAFAQWRELAKGSSWKDFAEEVKNGQELLDMAAAVK